MTLTELLQLFPDAKRQSDGTYKALCPAHDDHKPSLTIFPSNDEGWMNVHCFAGCAREDVLARRGLSLSDLGPDRPERTKPKSDLGDGYEKGFADSDVVSAYDYTDESGAILYQNCRLKIKVPGTKPFRQRRPDGKGGWVLGRGGIHTVPYHLPQLAEARESGALVLLVEGEKDVGTAESLGFMASTTGGATSWQRHHAEHFSGLQVISLPDNDKPGRSYAQKALGDICQFAKSTKMIDLPALPEKGDLTDWVGTGGTTEALRGLIEVAPEWKPPARSESTVETFHLTELGNAERLIAKHGTNIRYVLKRSCWIVWNGLRWVPDDTRRVQSLAIDTVMSMHVETAHPNTPNRKALSAHAFRSESKRALSAMLAIAEDKCVITPQELDGDPYLLCCASGVLDLETGELLTPVRENYITRATAVEYDPCATCPLWERFLERIMPDREIRAFLQRAVGYSLTGDVREQCFFFLYGGGANGKSTFIETIAELAGDYYQKLPIETFTLGKYGKDSRRELATLPGARLASVAEMAKGAKLDESLIKDLTGGDTVTARLLRQEQFNFQSGAKLWFFGNHKPEVQGRDEGIWRRTRLIPFTVQIPEAEWDLDLKAKLKGELPGILAWAVRGAQAWRDNGLEAPRAVREATDEYRAEQDTLAGFLAARCCFERRVKVAKKTLWEVYLAFVKETGEEYFEKKGQFEAEIAGRAGVKSDYGAHNAAIWRGVGLLTDAPEPPELSLGVNEVNQVNDFSACPDVSESHVGDTEKPLTALTSLTFQPQNGSPSKCWYSCMCGETLYPEPKGNESSDYRYACPACGEIGEVAEVMLRRGPLPPPVVNTKTDQPRSGDTER